MTWTQFERDKYRFSAQRYSFRGFNGSRPSEYIEQKLGFYAFPADGTTPKNNKNLSSSSSSLSSLSTQSSQSSSSSLSSLSTQSSQSSSSSLSSLSTQSSLSSLSTKSTQSSVSSIGEDCPSGQTYIELASGLEAHWKMNDSALDQVVLDDIGENNGTWQHGTTSLDSFPGKVGSSLNFNGNSDYVVVPNSSIFNTSVFTFCVWLKFDGASANWNRVISKKYAFSDTSGYEITLWSGDNSRMYISGSSGSVYASIATPFSWVGTGWHHVSVSYNQTNVKLYCDGLYVNQGTIAAVVSNSRSLFLGKIESESTTMWKGQMDDVRFYSGKNLTDQQISAIYNGNLGTESRGICQ